MTVSNNPINNHLRLFFLSAQCATVTVAPLVNKISVFKAGMPQGSMTSLGPTKSEGLGVLKSGQMASKFGHKISCVAGPLENNNNFANSPDVSPNSLNAKIRT